MITEFMRVSYWLQLIAPMGLLLGLSIIRFNYDYKWRHHNIKHENLHPWLIDKKIPIAKASMGELLTIKGLSLKHARKIRQFYQENPHLDLNAVTTIKGVKAKTYTKLSSKFY